MTFRQMLFIRALPQRANVWNDSFGISYRWPIYIINTKRSHKNSKYLNAFTLDSKNATDNWDSTHLFTLNPLHPNISIHIHHTVLCTFTKVLTRRLCLTIKSFFSWWSFPLFSWPLCVIQWWYCKEKDASHSNGLKD